MGREAGPASGQWLCAGRLAGSCHLIAVIAICASASCQDSPQPPANSSAGPLTAVHGLVRNGVSGEPLPRALVRINGDGATGVLTDGEGRFEISDVAEGPETVTVIKPGFLDQAEAVADSSMSDARDYVHSVIVAPEMGDVVFTMNPLNSIRGQIRLSTGDVAEGFQVALLKRTMQDGRAIWQSAASARTNSEGVYRFGELSDGLYAVYTEPAMDSEAANYLLAAGSGNNVPRQGYASVFYPEAHDLTGAAKISLAGGQQAEASIALTHEPFYSVTATVTSPKAEGAGGENVSVQVMDAQRHPLPYTAQYDEATHTAQAALPDGRYSMLATATPNLGTGTVTFAERFNAVGMASHSFTGEVSFTVASRAVSNLRLPLSAPGSAPVQVMVERGPGGISQIDDPRVFVTLSQTGGWMSDGIVSSYAEGAASEGVLQTTPTPPGSYWVHTSVGTKQICEASFTAGGASLGREPLVLGVAGASAPLVLTLRDDCAKLTLSLPDSVGLSAGEERSYTVYVVPDFDSTQDVVPQTLRPSTGGRITLIGLTPGSYHVYTFDRPVALEYRNSAVLATLPGQAVSLAPDQEAELTIEVPQR